MKLTNTNHCLDSGTKKRGQTNSKCFFIVLLLAFVFASFAEINAQQADTSSGSGITINTPFLQFDTKIQRPTVRLFGGMGNTTYDNPNYPGDFNSTNSLTLELGYATRKNYSPTFFRNLKNIKSTESLTVANFSPIEKLSFSGIFANFQFDELGSTEVEKNEPHQAYNQLGKSYAFGLTSLEGGNYKAVNIALLNGGGSFWTKLDLLHYKARATPIEPRIADGIRFADKYIAEISAFKVADLVSLNVGVSRSVVHERFLFGKWCGSMTIKEAADGLLGMFVSEIRNSSPLAYPVVNFLLQGALDFGFTELQKKRTTWPFLSPAGYIYDEFRIGLTFEF